MTTAWYLKKPDGSIYGPVPLTDLRLWAADGRVAPEDLLSADRAKWMPASRLESLEMNCVIRFRDGEEFGPLHRRAIAELILEGHVLPDEPVLDQTSGQTQPAYAAILRSLLDVPLLAAEPTLSPAMEDRVTGLTTERDALQKEAEDWQARTSALESELEALRASQEDTARQNQEEANTISRQLQESRERTVLLEQQLRQLEADLNAVRSDAAHRVAELTDERDRLIARQEELVAERDRLAAGASALEDKAVEAAERIAVLSEARDRLTESMKVIEVAQQGAVEQCAAASEKLEQATQQCEGLAQENTRLAEALTTASSEVAELSHARERIVALEGELQSMRQMSPRPEEAASGSGLNTVVRAALAREQAGLVKTAPKYPIRRMPPCPPQRAPAPRRPGHP